MLNALKSVENVISVNRNILSSDGSALYGEFEVVAKTVAEGQNPGQNPGENADQQVLMQ